MLYQLCTHLCSEHLFLDMGKKLVELGFKDVGYEFVNIDVSGFYNPACNHSTLMS